jgi:hypothetical protein
VADLPSFLRFADLFLPTRVRLGGRRGGAAQRRPTGRMRGPAAGLTSEPASTSPEIDNGTTGEAAFICFVSANNYA